MSSDLISSSRARIQETLDKQASIIQSAADLRSEEEETRAAETRYLEALALQASALLDSPAVRDMRLASREVYVESFKLLKRRKSTTVYLQAAPEQPPLYSEKSHSVQAGRALGFDAGGQLWVFDLPSGSFVPVTGSLPELLSVKESVRYLARTGPAGKEIVRTVRLAEVVKDFASFIEGCSVTHGNALIEVRARRDEALKKTPRL